MHDRDLFDAPPRAKRPGTTRSRRPKPRKRPSTLGECKPGDIVVIHVCVTAHLNRAPFGRVVAGDHESELFDLPADGRLVDVIKQVP